MLLGHVGAQVEELLDAVVRPVEVLPVAADEPDRRGRRHGSALLGEITAPTLVLAADHDLIRLEHILTIYRSLPNAELAIFPNSTHMVLYDDPELFNTTVDRFLVAPFRKIDLIPETMASFEKMLGGLPK